MYTNPSHLPAPASYALACQMHPTSGFPPFSRKRFSIPNNALRKYFKYKYVKTFEYIRNKYVFQYVDLTKRESYR